MPIFGMVAKSRVADSRSCQDQLKELALQVVSTQVSDEANIIRLIDLARQQQLVAIEKECGESVVVTQVGERITINAQAVGSN
ncbi:signal transduction histidine kinase [Serratia sp. 509]